MIILHLKQIYATPITKALHTIYAQCAATVSGITYIAISDTANCNTIYIVDT